MGYMKKMWMEMLLEPPFQESKTSIYSQAIDEAIEALSLTQQKGVYTDHKLAQAWLAMRILQKAKEKANEISE